MMRRPLSLTSTTYRLGDPYVLMPTMRRTWARPGLTLPVLLSNVNPTPGTITRSSQPFRIAGSPLHHVG